MLSKKAKKTKRDEYVEKLKNRLDEWNDDVDHLKARATETRKEYREHIASLQAKRRDCEKKLRKLIQSAETAWEDMKSGVDAAADDLGKGVKIAKARFGAPGGKARR